MRITWSTAAAAAGYLFVALLVGVVAYFSFSPPQANAEPAPVSQTGPAVPAGDNGGFLGTGIYITDRAADQLGSD